MASKKVKLKDEVRPVALPVPIRLESLSFTEFLNDPKEWRLEEITFDQINLIVGKNASGKSRLLNVIAGLANMLSGRLANVFQSGKYVGTFSAGTKKYQYFLETEAGKVTQEKLVLNDTLLLDRGKDGIGKIWAEKIQQIIDFETPPNQIAARSRRDSIQHPFLEDLHTWASLLRHYQFGTSLGKDRLLLITDLQLSEGRTVVHSEANDLLKLYATAFEEFGAEFDRAILRDLRLLGYDCTAVDVEPVDTATIQFQGIAPMWLTVQERGLTAKTNQINMSQGMFRALALVIHLNYCIFSKTPRTVLVDDIGEGLDFSRAQSFISLLIKHSKANALQLVMTSNDRFVMNGVPLDYWGVIKRVGSTVHLTNKKNSPKVFEDFSDLGLNNFDFFATEFFEDGLK